MSVILSTVLGNILQEIEAATNSNAVEKNSVNNLLNEQKLIKWTDLHVGLMLLTQQINTHFGLIFLVTYCLDFLAVLGSAARFVISAAPNEQHAGPYYAVAFLGIFIFGVSATFLPIPMVAVHEKV